MAEPVLIEVAGHPQGKGRARATIRSNKAGRQWVGTYTPGKTRSYESIINGAAQEAMKGRDLFEGPVSVTLVAIFDIPASYSRAKKSAALAGNLRPTKKPDSDNICKSYHDAMNGVIFKDDAQIVHSECTKKYGPAPKVVAIVRPL